MLLNIFEGTLRMQLKFKEYLNIPKNHFPQTFCGMKSFQRLKFLHGAINANKKVNDARLHKDAYQETAFLRILYKKNRKIQGTNIMEDIEYVEED